MSNPIVQSGIKEKADMKTLGRNKDNDLYIEAGNLAIVTDADAQCEIIESVLMTQKGELQFDAEKGVDYFGTILQNATPSNLDLWSYIVKEQIEALEFVSSVEDFTYEFDGKTGTLKWDMRVLNTDDEILNLKERKLVLDGSPGVDVAWDTIYDKPLGSDEALKGIEQMQNEALINQPNINNSTSLAQAKGLFNDVTFTPNDPKYQQSKTLEFHFSGVPLGTVIDFSRCRINILNTGATAEDIYYAPFIISINDGTTVNSLVMNKDIVGEGNKILFQDTTKPVVEGEDIPTTSRHTIMKGGDVTISIRGNITGIWSSNAEGEKDDSLPIMLNSAGKPFPYLSKIVIGSKVPLQYIGPGSFASYANLQSITWEEFGVSSITLESTAFLNCKSLNDLKWLPHNVTHIGEACFKGCSTLQSLEGYEKVLLERVPADCFNGCTSLKTVNHLPDSTSTIGERAFANCSSLSNIHDLPDTVSTMEDAAFSGCYGMTELLYPPKSLASLGRECFSNCTSLHSVYLPSTLTDVGEGCFYQCSSLTNILIEAETPPSTEGAEIFDQDNLSIYVPATALSAYQNADGWKKYWNVEAGEGSIYKFGTYEFQLHNVSPDLTLLNTTNYLASDSIWIVNFYEGAEPLRYLNSVNTLPQYTYDKSGDAKITIKGYIRELSAKDENNYPFLADTAADNFDNLVSIDITDSPLETIGDYAFAKCINLNSVNLNFPEDHEQPYRLGMRTFWYCSSLEDTSWLQKGLGSLIETIEEREKTDVDGNVIIGTDGQPIIESIPIYYDAFGEGCFQYSGITQLSYAPDYVTSLPPYCFSGTAIGTLAGMGMNVASLGEGCFEGCSSLASLGYLNETQVRTLPAYCFANCTELESVTGFELIQSPLGEHLFEGCAALQSLEWIASCPNITELSAYMFKGCSSLPDLVGITEKITNIGNYCFSDCTGIINIWALDNAVAITSLSEGCFAGCTHLQTLIGCTNISVIGTSCFDGCNSLCTTSGLGRNISSIQDNAFRNCTNLKYVTCISQSVPMASSSAFTGVAISSIPLYVLEATISMYRTASVWQSFGRVLSRFIKLHFNNLSSIGSDIAANTLITTQVAQSSESTIPGVWYVDYGDGTQIEMLYGKDITQLPLHSYSVRGGYDITLYGDIAIIGSGNTDYTEDESTNDITTLPIPFMGQDMASLCSSITIQSDYLKKIDDCCFCNYGPNPEGGNDNVLSLTLSLGESSEIGNAAFAKTSAFRGCGIIENISNFNPVKVGDYAFYQVGLLTSSPFQTVATAGKGAFKNNKQMWDVEGFTSLTAVAESTFEGCSLVESTTGIGSVTSIAAKAFFNCPSLLYIKNLSSELVSIEELAFGNCPNIRDVFIAQDNPPSLAENGFDRESSDENIRKSVYKKANLYVPATKESAYESAEGWRQFDNIQSRSITFTLSNVSPNTTIKWFGSITATGGWTISYGNQETISFSAGTTTPQSYTFTNRSVENIEVKISGAVVGLDCTNSSYPLFGQRSGSNTLLTSIKSMDAMEITSLGDYLFKGCTKLATVDTMPSVVSLGTECFSGCTALADVSGLSSVASIEDSAFLGCTGLKSVYGMSSVTTIGPNAFRGAGLSSIDGFGVNVASIGDNAFNGCPLSEVQMFASEPPTLTASSFAGVDTKSLILYVRTKSLDAYNSKLEWKGLFSDIQSRFIEFTLSECPVNLIVNREQKGRIESNTYCVADWDAFESTGIDCKSGLNNVYLPTYTYVIGGNHTFRLEGAVTGIYGLLDSSLDTFYSGLTKEEILGSATTRFLDLTTSDTDSETGEVSYTQQHVLVKAERSEYSVLSTIGDAAFFNETKLADSFLSGIISIGKCAFAFNTAMTTTTMLDYVNSIGNYAFFGCTGLTSIVGLNGNPGFSIGIQAFGGNYDETHKTRIEYIQVGVSNPDDAVITSTSFGDFDAANPKGEVTVYVPQDAISAYKALSTDSPWNGFKWGSQIISFTFQNIPSGTSIIGKSATNSFGIGRVTSDSRWTIDWGDGTKDIMGKDETAFPSHTYTYNPEAPYLERAKWDKTTVNGASTYSLASVTITITGTITALSCQTGTTGPFFSIQGLANNPYLTTVTAPEDMTSLTILGNYVFKDCTVLSSITGFTNITTIGQSTFQGCVELGNIGNAYNGFINAISIGNSAFSGCSNLRDLTSFASAVTIGAYAFENCISLVGTTGLGSKYNYWGIETIYETETGDRHWQGAILNKEIDKPDGIYDLTDLPELKIKVVAEGWKKATVTIQANTVVSWAWGKPSNNLVPFYGTELLLPSIGAYAFSGCGFGAIDMECYAIPPTIQTTTFPGNPSSVTVFVPDGSEEVYKTTPPWTLYFANIIGSSSIGITFAENVIRAEKDIIDDETTVTIRKEGIALVGENCKFTFSSSTLIIDWGDGTTSTLAKDNAHSETDPWVLPNHIYTTGIERNTTVRIKGAITSIYTEDADNQPWTKVNTPETLKPCIYLAPWSATKSSESEAIWDYTIDKANPILSPSIQTLSIGNSSKLANIGSFCFVGLPIQKIENNQFPTEQMDENDVIISDGTFSIGDGAFWCKNEEGTLSEVVSQYDSINSIGAHAFENQTKLESTYWARGSRTIGNSAFKGCANIKDTTGLTAVSSIGDESFMNCISITQITLPSTLTSLGRSAFEGCSGVGGTTESNMDGILWEAVSPYSLDAVRDGESDDSTTEAPTIVPEYTIGARAFYGVGSESGNTAWKVKIPAHIKTISTSAFSKCSMAEFTWGTSGSTETYELSYTPTSTTEVTPGIFEQCTNLKTVTIYHKLPQISNRTFCGCIALADVSFPGGKGPSEIQPYAFFDCGALTGKSFNSIVGNATGSLGMYSFARCYNLANKMVIPGAISNLGEGCFSRASKYFFVGAYAAIEDSIANNTTINYSIPEFPEYKKFSDFEKYMTDTYSQCRIDVWEKYDNILSFSTPDEIATVNWSITWAPSAQAIIGDGCFMNCYSLDSVTINLGENSSLARIPNYCFYGCNELFIDTQDGLKNLPATITSFGRFAFAHTGIKSLGRGDAGKLSASLSPAMFLGCASLETLGTPGEGNDNGLANLFSNSITYIPDACFYNCSRLENITILQEDVTATRLGNYCFAYCTKLHAGDNADLDISASLKNVTNIGDGCFMNCAGLSGQFNGLPLVTYYPYLSFYKCSSISIIKTLAAADTSSQVTLEGRSFGGIAGIQWMYFPYTTNMVAIIPATGESGIGSDFSYVDPFDAITNKGNVGITVSPILASTYERDAYWSQYDITTSAAGDSAIEFIVQVPAQGGILSGAGEVTLIDGDTKGFQIDWGDGHASSVHMGPVVNLSDDAFKHTYAASSDAGDYLVTIRLIGAIKTISGVGDNLSSDVLANKTLIPCLFNKVTLREKADDDTGDDPTQWTGPIKHAENTWLAKISILSPSISDIGEGCFSNCSRLTDIEGFINVTNLGNNAFFGCSSLNNLDFLSPNIVGIGSYCFARCTKLRDFTRFSECSNLTDISIGCFNSLSLDGAVFERLDNTWLPPNITKIGRAAFHKVYIKEFNYTNSTNTAVEIDAYAFRQNSRLTSLAGMKMNVKGTNAFRDCTALTTLEGWDTTNTEIPRSTFRGCTGLQNLSGIPESITKINNGAFAATSITTLEGLNNKTETTSSIQTLGDEGDPKNVDTLTGVFEGCLLLESTQGIPNTVTSLGVGLFKGCEKLKDLVGMNDITLAKKTDGTYKDMYPIPDSCFSGCIALTAVSGTASGVAWGLPPNSTALGKSCFLNCRGLMSIAGLPSGITFIGESCFEGCTGLTALTGLTSELSSMGNAAFKNCTQLSDISILSDMNNLSELPEEGFRNCTAIVHVPNVWEPTDLGTYPKPRYSLSSNLLFINAKCFLGCTSIRTIICSRAAYQIQFTEGVNEGNFVASITWLKGEGNDCFSYQELTELSGSDSVKIYIPSGSYQELYKPKIEDIQNTYIGDWVGSSRFTSDNIIQYNALQSGNNAGEIGT